MEEKKIISTEQKETEQKEKKLHFWQKPKFKRGLKTVLIGGGAVAGLAILKALFAKPEEEDEEDDDDDDDDDD